MAERYEVVIVGGGPVGVALGVELGMRSVSCAVVERYPEPQRIPKGQNLTQRTAGAFLLLGRRQRTARRPRDAEQLPHRRRHGPTST